MSVMVIIGAGPGIGLSVAHRFGKEGYDIGLIARSSNMLQHMQDELTSAGINTIYAVADVAKPESLKEALFTINHRLSYPELYLYNAAGFHYQNILGMDWKTMEEDFNINVGGFFHLMRLILPRFMELNRGNVLITGGGVANHGNANLTTLSVGKAALRNLMQAYQEQLEGSNIFLGMLTIEEFVNAEDKRYNPTQIAEEFWKLYQERSNYSAFEVSY